MFLYKVGRAFSVENKYVEPVSRASKRAVGLCFLVKGGCPYLSLPQQEPVDELAFIYNGEKSS